jgi:hypothetical protein
MYKSLAGMAAAAALTMVAVSTAPANAAPIKNAPGLTEHQAGVEQVQYRRYHRRYYRGYYGPRRFYGGGPYYYGGYAPYAYAPYPYYRRYYAPRPFIGIGPFGFGVW